MILRNKTRKTVVTKELTLAKNMQKVRGLMGESQPRALLLETHFGIHTCFLEFPIDILILDDTGKVIKHKKSLSPWRIFLWNPKHQHVLELPFGTIEKSKTQLGDILQFY